MLFRQARKIGKDRGDGLPFRQMPKYHPEQNPGSEKRRLAVADGGLPDDPICRIEHGAPSPAHCRRIWETRYLQASSTRNRSPMRVGRVSCSRFSVSYWRAPASRSCHCSSQRARGAWARIQRLMKVFIYTAGITGVLQILTVLIMTFLASR